MNSNHFGIIVLLLVIIGGSWYFLSRDTVEAPAPGESVNNQMPVVGSTTPEMIVANSAPASVTVKYTDQGFSPKEITIESGMTVNFVNESSKKMWVASAKHPDHTVYSGTSLSQHCPDTANISFDECRGDDAGYTFTFNFNKEGVWKYHDHLDPTKFGSVTVTKPVSVSATTSIQISI